MRARLLALVLPAAAVSVLLGASALGAKAGIIPPWLWLHLWPWLVAVLYLVLAAGALLLRRPLWIWPPLAAFLAEVLCIVLFYLDKAKTRELLGWPLATFVFFVFVWCVVWLVAFLRSRRLEQGIARGMGVEGVDAEKLRQIRQEMMDALKTLQRAGRGRNAIYDLPWCLVVGRPAAGKTVAIKNSDLGLPVRKDWVKGVGGTYTANFFFTNHLIFVDTPGGWVEKGVTEDGEKLWDELLRLLRRYRGRQPLDGLIVVVPADDLLGRSRQELVQQAGNIRDVIDLIHDKLRFRFPVYLLVSKTDLVEGFVDFFKGLPAKRRHQIFGWSHSDPNDPASVQTVRRGFRRLLRRLQAARLEILARTPYARAVQRLFFFTEEFNRLEEPLVDFTETLFQEDPSHDTPVFRGVYFTSGTQGEGVPLGAALAELARKLGIRSGTPAATEEEPKRSYFLKDLFREVMVRDEGLVGRTAWHWWQRRRDTALAAFLPAALAWLFVGLSAISLLWNKNLYARAEQEVPLLARQAAEAPDVLSALERTGEIYAWVHDLEGFAPHRGFFMRRAAPLSGEIERIFREQLTASVVKPTLEAAAEFARDGDNSLAERVDALYAVVWLRRGQRSEPTDDLRAFKPLWPGLNDEQLSQARGLLVDQFGYVSRTNRDARLLEGIDLMVVAEELAAEVEQKQEAGSSYDNYLKFQESCFTPANVEILDCYDKLGRIVNFGTAEAGRLKKSIQALIKDLNALPTEPGAREARQRLMRVDEKLNMQRHACPAKFDDDVVGTLREFYDRQQELIDECKSQVDPRSPLEPVTEIVKKQEEALRPHKENIKKTLYDFTDDRECRDFLSREAALEAEPIFVTAERYRRVQCSGRIPVRERPAPRSDSTAISTAIPRTPVSRPRLQAGFTYFKVPERWPSAVMSEDWQRLRDDLLGKLRDAESLDADERDKERQDVRSRVTSFSRKFQHDWKNFFSEVGPPTVGAVPAKTLRAIAESGKLEKLLKPAADVVAAALLVTEPEFMDFRTTAEGLGVSRFYAVVPDYNQQLREVADDIEKCERSPTALREYRSKIDQGDSSTGLVGALKWVDEHAGHGLVDGALKSLLRRPFEEARDYVKSSGSNLVGGQFLALDTQWRNLAGKFPFAGAESSDMAEEQEVKQIFGQASGSVPALSEVLAGGNVAQSFSRALELSQVFFEPDEDNLRPLALELAIHVKEPQFGPEEIESSDKWRLESFAFVFGGDQISWKAEEDETKARGQTDIHLFGRRAVPGTSEIKIAVAKKNLLGKVPGVGSWKPQEPRVAAEASGLPWSLMRVLAQGEVVHAEPNLVRLVYTAPFDFKKKNDGTVKVTIEASGNGVGTLLDLLHEGLGPPPPMPAE